MFFCMIFRENKSSAVYKFCTLHKNSRVTGTNFVHCSQIQGTNFVPSSRNFCAWYKMCTLYVVVNFAPCTDTLLLHIQDAAYKLSPATFSSRPGGCKCPLTGKEPLFNGFFCPLVTNSFGQLLGQDWLITLATIDLILVS